MVIMLAVIPALVMTDIQKLNTENVDLPSEDTKEGVVLIESQTIKTKHYEQTLELIPENGSTFQLHLYCYGVHGKYAEAPADFTCHVNDKLVIQKTFYMGSEKIYTFKVDEPKTYTLQLTSPYGDDFSILIAAEQFNLNQEQDFEIV